MKRKALNAAVLVTALALGTAMISSPSLAHGPDGQGYRGGYGMHGGHMSSGMMGYGAGGQGDCPYTKAALNEEVTVETVTKLLEQRLSHMGNDRLKLGEVKAKDDGTIVAEIVTVDDSLVQKLEFDRKTGLRRHRR